MSKTTTRKHLEPHLADLMRPDAGQIQNVIHLLRGAIALARMEAPYSTEVQAALDEWHIAPGCADLVGAAENALALFEELYPTLHPTETTHDAAIWHACEWLRSALAGSGDGPPHAEEAA